LTQLSQLHNAGVLSDEEILAIRFGAQSGTLAATLRDVLDESQPPRVQRFPQLRRAFVYFVCLILIAAFIVTFIQIKIVPEFEKIFQEFSVAVPESLIWSIRFGHIISNYWYVWTLLVIVFAWLAFSAWPGRQLRHAILARLFRPLRELRTADVLRKLSVTTQAGRPIPGAISTLARYHFDPTLRHQLLFIRNEMEQGADLWQSLAAIGLLSPPEVRVLETAARVGNRPWALKQLALAKKRRTIRRLSQWSKLVLPGLVLLMGAFVLFQALSVFGPLVQIVTSLL
jgi:type II secretory pathway component PulF